MHISSINIFIGFLWLLSASVDYAEFCYLWQLKEYRWDRFRDFLSTHHGKTYWLTPTTLWRSMVALVLFFWPFDDVANIKLALLLILSLDAIRSIRMGIGHRMRHPKFTPKAAIIFASSIALEGACIVIAKEWALVFLFLIARFFLLSFVVFLFRFPTDAIKRWRIRAAEKKILAYPKLRVIGITGSYGKTTTKTFLAHIMGGAYRVIATPKHVNTEIGVALFILRTDFDQADFFIVEMGAYRIGEIRAICDMVHPEIGILTAINEQHLSLFGSIDAIQKTKYELLRSLPPSGLAVTNADNPYCRAFLSELRSRAQTFGYEEAEHPTLLIESAEQKRESISCQFLFKDDRYEVDAPILGAHNAVNIAACFLVARHCGMNAEKILERCRTLELPDKALHMYRYGACTILNDSYNSNPDGFKSALHILSGFPSDRRRIVITRGMLELGVKSDELHERIGEEISFCADELVLVSREYERPLRSGIAEKYRTTIVIKDKPEDLLAYVRSLRDTPCVILLENRIPTMVYKELIPV